MLDNPSAQRADPRHPARQSSTNWGTACKLAGQKLFQRQRAARGESREGEAAVVDEGCLVAGVVRRDIPCSIREMNFNPLPDSSDLPPRGLKKNFAPFRPSTVPAPLPLEPSSSLCAESSRILISPADNPAVWPASMANYFP